MMLFLKYTIVISKRKRVGGQVVGEVPGKRKTDTTRQYEVERYYKVKKKKKMVCCSSRAFMFLSL